MSHIAVATVYHPPDGSGRLLISYLLDSLDKLVKDHSFAGVVMLGDFNRLPDTSLLSYPLKQVVRVY